ncbi:MAG: PolC-type DNA polymerase III, partial [Clostridiales bacterium]|nr:PolC-type DNA polymerase III [Clostridiales bacterium]
VNNIYLDEKNNLINIDMMSKNIIHAKHFFSLSEEININFTYIDTVNINIYFDIDLNTHEKLKSIWENIVFIVKRDSPVCANLLESSNFVVNGNKIIVNVKNNASFILIKKAVDFKIRDYLKMVFKADFFIEFKDIVLSQADREKQRAGLIEKEEAFIGNEIKKPPSSASINYNNVNKGNPEQNKFSFNENIDRRRSNIKYTANLAEQYRNIVKLSEDLQIGAEIIVTGEIFEIDLRETKSGKYLVSFCITDKANSISIKFFIKPENYNSDFKGLIKNGNHVIVKGAVNDDEFSREVNIMAKEIGPLEKPALRMDNEEEKRVELHLHTHMSSMDGISSTKSLIERAIYWGHKAIAITDHGVVQAFPEALDICNKNKGKIKIIYGVEAYLVDDLGAIVESPKSQPLDTEYVVFDIETTGLSNSTDHIIEIGAVKLRGGQVFESFNTFVNPNIKIPEKITELTNITDDMLVGAPDIREALTDFLTFVGGSVLVAHNASFDTGFIRAAAGRINISIQNTVLDTLELSRLLLPELSRHKLNIIAGHMGVSLENHHRACDDAKATAEIYIKFIDMLKAQGVNNLDGINIFASNKIDKKKLKTYHAIILVKNYIGLRNLYELISKSHLEYFYRRPRIPKSEFIKLREGLILGSACEAGEIFQAVYEKKPTEFIKALVDFYDYLEVQPIENNMFMLRNGKVPNPQALISLNKELIALGDMYSKPVVATCDVHFLDSGDDIYRRVIMFAEGFKDADIQAPLYYRNTEEMFKEFNYLAYDKAKEIIVTNPNMIADMVEIIKPIPDETFPPKIDGAEEEVKRISIEKAKSIYGSNLPNIVNERLEKELSSIIKNGFSVMYIIAQKLVWKSLEDGYLVGSRGSVGSSFVATMLSITEVNPLQPHYICPACKYSDFESDTVKQFLGASGCDMPDKYCPKCGTLLNKDGHDIPFETFLGFDGDKEPDIDLNFSGEYQAKAHAYTEELFGSGYVFKAGTIGTIADKTAYGFVKKYFEEKGLNARPAEINRLRNGCTGIKRTTGQHPGGLMIVPTGHSIYEFCPIQRPANDVKSNITTTHFDYHSISGRLLKLDILGHDVPTIIRYLHDTTQVDPTTVDLGDKKVMSLFTSAEALGINLDDIGCKTGSLGLPEFGTSFVRQMLLDTSPGSFAELVRISGLSHGTDVWFNNAQELIKDGVATLKEVIPTRDDIMVYLINKGVEKKAAFKIMENVRKGRGLTEDEVNTMKASNVPDWYIESCRRIKYMFPKGHAVAYVMMTVRIGYFKIYYPYSFYGAAFSVKAEDFDYELMCQGTDKVYAEIKRLNSIGKEISAKEKGTLTTLELVYEMYKRGLKFLPLDLYNSDARKFKVTSEGLLPPLSSVQGLGANAAAAIVAARGDGEFLTVEEFRNRAKTTKTVIQLLKKLDILKGIPDTDQLSFF